MFINQINHEAVRGKLVVATEAEDIAGTEAEDVATAIQCRQRIVADFFEGDVLDVAPIGDTGIGWIFPMRMNLLALYGRFRQRQIFESN